MTTNDQDPKALNLLYNKTLDQYEAKLDRIEAAFDDKCEEIRIAAHQKLDALPKNDRAGRARVLEEEKKELDQVVLELKTAIGKGSREMRTTLEKIQAQADAVTTEMENELNAL